MTDLHEPSLPPDVRLIDDMHQGEPHVIATYLLLGDEPALVDPGPASTLSTLEAGLAANGLALADVRALLLTHIHLDHAGASGAIVARHPHIRVYVHERGAPHMVAPERLLRSAARLYGDAMEQLWGDVLAVPEQNITTFSGIGGDRPTTVQLGARSLRVYDAPGHASHHVIYFEESSGLAFTGDTAGVRLPGFSYVRPPTPPPDIDIEAWERTLGLLRSLQPQTLLLTHFGPARDVAGHLERFQKALMRWATFVREGLLSGDDEPTQMARFRAMAEAELGAAGADAVVRYQHAAGFELSWHGLARYWRKRTG